MIVKYHSKAQFAPNFASVLQLTLLAVVVSASCRVRAADNSDAPVSIPLVHRFDRLGIYLSIGKEGPRQYIFDTGSTQFNAAFTKAPDVPGLKIIGSPQAYTYGRSEVPTDF
ncbi:hypothetical protein JFU49_07715 [Pseudomonas sp. TH03]|uniref:hypothetical protein n=1 Tax=Pseudomonas sp. TH03 TaxID=2796369 RepID=UPI0019126241|nr:hypothetical protein [Pseudomonas sp. TH03]MBK5550164.1 hypothetical protein [Pseudomonas sp. TH03]